ncbi:MAG: hypothetical protein Q8P92_01935 [Candidatus Daviesbacteria bacterium]|nr:hypothetical protein [Candidatus Daviesbacteria bacterium]
MNEIAIIGFGHVGRGMKSLFPNALIYDPGYQEYNNTRDQINKACALAIICVSTPLNKDGSCDVSAVESSVKWLKTPLILIKSTVEPGTTDRLRKRYKKRICMSPEYFGEFSYWIPKEWSSAKDWPYLIIGGEEKDATEIMDYFIPILGPYKKYYICNAKEAELIKYMENAYLATKVTFVNEMFEICRKLGANWYKVWEGWALDPRVDKSHSGVFPQNRGFGGRCLPKDLSALIKTAQKFGYTPTLLQQVVKSNSKFRRK